MKIVMETLQGIRYKLRMMGVPNSCPSYIYGDNMLVIHNTQFPEVTLKKNSNSICYHDICESVSMGASITEHVGTNENCSDVATKVLYVVKHKFHASKLLHDIYEHLRAF